jgi:hypothetical protein
MLERQQISVATAVPGDWEREKESDGQKDLYALVNYLAMKAALSISSKHPDAMISSNKQSRGRRRSRQRI